MARATAEVTLSSSENRLDLLADVCKLGRLNGMEKQELISSLEKGNLRDVLHSWSRRQLKNYLNLKTGEEKKYTSYSKHKLIDRLLSMGPAKCDLLTTSSSVKEQNVKEEKEPAANRARKGESPSVEMSNPHNCSVSLHQQSQIHFVCKNSACRGKLSATDLFCRRCSCCICHLFDDNKDPSLWIVCNGGRDGQNRGCNLSSHVECAFKLGVAGVVQKDAFKLDGNYYCPSCGVISDLLECLKKQIWVAKEARRIDILCYRLYLTFRLLNGTTQYQKLLKIVSDAAYKLEQEIGPLNEASATLVRGIVGRLSTGAEVQKLLQSALEKAKQYLLEAESQSESVLQGSALSISHKPLEGQDQSGDGQGKIVLHFVGETCTSITVSWDISKCVDVQDVIVQKIWHREASQTVFTGAPTVELSNNEQKVTICSLEAGTEYDFKLLAFGKGGIIAQGEGRCFTKDSLHLSSHKNQVKASGKSASIPLDIRNLLKESVGALTIDDIDTTFRVRDLGNTFHIRNSESTPTELTSSATHFSCKEEGLKCDLQENRILGPSNAASCPNILASPEFPVVLLEQGSRKRSRPSTLKTQEKALVSNSNLDPCKGATEPQKLHSITNGSAIDPPGQSECIIRVLDSEISPSVSRSKDSGDASPNEFLLTDVSPATNVATSGDRFGIDGKRHGFQFENFRDCNLQQNDELRLILHPSIQVEVTELNSRKRLMTGVQQGQNIRKWDSLHQQHSESEDFFEIWVKIVRWLECEGHLGAHFRMRFLSWLGLRATEREKRVITAFLNSMLDDPTSLAEQLMDTFQEIITKPQEQVAD